MKYDPKTDDLTRAAGTERPSGPEPETYPMLTVSRPELSPGTCWLCQGPIGNAPASVSVLGLECDDCRDAYAEASDRMRSASGGVAFSVRGIV